MKKENIRSLFIILSAIFVCFYAYDHVYAESNETNIKIISISDKSQLSGTENNVFVLTSDEYRAYIDGKLPLESLTVEGTTPFVYKALNNTEYYIGVEIFYDTDIIKPEMTSVNSIMPLPEKYYVDDMYCGYGRGTRVDFGPSGKLEMKFSFVKWYRVFTYDSTENVTALFLSRKEGINMWKKYYPSGNNFEITDNAGTISGFWEKLSEIGLSIPGREKSAIIELLRRGGKVFLSRNDYPFILFVNPYGRINFFGRIGVEELQEMSDYFLDINKLPLNILPLSSRKVSNAYSTNNTELAEKLQISAGPLTAGANEIRVYNPNSTVVTIAIREGRSGTIKDIHPSLTSSVYVPDGEYEMFFIFSDKPDTLFQGDNVKINGNGIEISLFQVVNGNYSLKQVR